MSGNSKNLLCGYRYDPLNRLVANTSPTQANTQRFYFQDRLATQVQAALAISIMQNDDQLLAQRQSQNGSLSAQLLVTDQQRSVLHILDDNPRPLAYSPYGHRPIENGLLGFNGESPDAVTGCYLLGNGYRVYNPVLMRFHSTDSWSPFGESGPNTYAYCVGDPVNRQDPSGHVPFAGGIGRAFSRVRRLSSPRPSSTSSAPGRETPQADFQNPMFARPVETPVLPTRQSLIENSWMYSGILSETTNRFLPFAPADLTRAEQFFVFEQIISTVSAFRPPDDVITQLRSTFLGRNVRGPVSAITHNQSRDLKAEPRWRNSANVDSLTSRFSTEVSPEFLNQFLRNRRR